MARNYMNEGMDLIAYSMSGGMIIGDVDHSCGTSKNHRYLPPSEAELYDVVDGHVFMKKRGKRAT